MSRKCEKHRGSRTHGRGWKAGRGAGKRGGRGNAGLHKHKYITTVKFMPDHFGGYGFKRPQSVVSADSVQNIRWIRENMENEHFADTSGPVPIIDLNSIGIDKLLGAGSIDKPVKVIVKKVSAKAEEKIKGAGGEIINPDSSPEE